MTRSARILLVDDEVSIQRALAPLLRGRGYDVDVAGTARDALQQFAARPHDLVVLDLGLPDMEGTEVCRRIRQTSKAPVIVLSARGSDTDKVNALDLGADDYVTKPFAMNELLARLRAAVRRRATDASGSSRVTVGDLDIDLARKRVARAGTEVRLTPTEWGFLELLARNVGRLVTREQILREVWGPAYVGETHYLRVYAAQLRRKLEADPARPAYLITTPGVGYTLG